MKIVAVIQVDGVEVHRGEIKREADICYWRSVPYIRLYSYVYRGERFVLYVRPTCEGLEWD